MPQIPFYWGLWKMSLFVSTPSKSFDCRSFNGQLSIPLMEVGIKVLKTEIKRRATSTEIKSFFAVEDVELDDFIMTVWITDSYENRYKYTGSVFSGAEEIVASCGINAKLGVLSEGRTRIFAGSEQPILHCIYKLGDSIKMYGLCKLLFLESRYPENPIHRIPIQSRASFLRLKRIRLTHCDIEKIPDFSHMELTHLDLSHNSISGSICLDGVFNWVNLSHNRISKVIKARAYSLNLSHNDISRFSQRFKYQHLNLSHNPLESYSGKAQVLNLSHTRLLALESIGSKKIFLDGTKNIKLEKLKGLRFLSVNDCDLRSLVFKSKKLRVLRARNNFLENIPHFPGLEYLDVSGNLIYRISSKRLKFLNASKNQLIRFDLSNWVHMMHLDLSYNPIMEFDLLEVPKNLRFLNLNGTSFSSSKGGFGRFNEHICEKRNKVARKFTMDRSCCMYKSFFMVAVMDAELDISKVLRMVQSKISNASDSLEYFQRFRHLLEKSLFEMGLRLEFVLCMATPKNVIFCGNGLGIIFSNFAEVRMLRDPMVIHVYDNVGCWNFIPVFCSLRHNIARFDIFDTFRNDLEGLLDFMDYKCPVALKMTISNVPELYNKPISCGTDERILSINLFEETMHEWRSEDGSSRIAKASGLMYGCENYNPVLESSMRWCYNSLLTNPNPIFVFCKLSPRNIKHNYHCITGNVRNIVKMANHAFFGTNLEFFSDYCIVAFNDRVEACLWALKIQDMLKHLELDVRIGITCGIFYTKIVDNHVRFYGPALIKAARLAKVGVGVFCCHCVWTKHAKIVYVEQGLRYLGGFKEPHLIYTPQLSDEAT